MPTCLYTGFLDQYVCSRTRGKIVASKISTSTLRALHVGISQTHLVGSTDVIAIDAIIGSGGAMLTAMLSLLCVKSSSNACDEFKLGARTQSVNVPHLHASSRNHKRGVQTEAYLQVDNNSIKQCFACLCVANPNNPS